MVNEGDSSFTTPDMTLSCNLSSVDLEGASSHVHLDDYISTEGDSLGFPPSCFGHTVTRTLLETIIEVGSALRGTRELM